MLTVGIICNCIFDNLYLCFMNVNTPLVTCYCFREVIRSWEYDEMFFIKPNPSFFDGTSMVPASKLTAAKDAEDCHFCLRNIAEIDNHESADYLVKNLESIVADRMKRNPRLWRFVLDCCRCSIQNGRAKNRK